MTYDSTADTVAHIELVQHYMLSAMNNLSLRAGAHDASKLTSPEKEVFDIVTPKLRGLTYDSPEYRASLKEMGEALAHHYQNNSHHPEHYDIWKCQLCQSFFCADDISPATHVSNHDGSPMYLCPKCCEHGSIYEAALEPGHGIVGMSLFDLLEMLADWKAATARHANGDMATSLEKNINRFHIGPELAQILANTIKETGW